MTGRPFAPTGPRLYHGTMQTPVVLILFNRPEPTARVFETIRRARPRTLFLIADGPRLDHPEDDHRCAATRAVVDQVDWECDVIRDFSDANLGCGVRVATGLDAVFAQVERAIILEDDCVADPTFFPYCAELLDRFEDDERIMAISGNNFQFGRHRTADSYYFSRFNHCWGWASWRRAWRHFDFEMSTWPQVRDGHWLQDILGSRREARYWSRIFEHMYNQEINAWAARWTYACWCQNGLTILPSVNLVSNIGFGEDGTHTVDQDMAYAALSTQPMAFPLQHPQHVIRDKRADKFTNRVMFARPPHARLALRLKNLRRKLARLSPGPR